MRGSTLIICLIFLNGFIGCKRYYMANMLGEDNVNVTSLIVGQHYIPVYCKDNICQLINPNPSHLSLSQIDTVYKYTSTRLSNYKISFNPDSLFVLIRNGIQYNYTYIITYDPVDVFYADFSIREFRISEEIRIENDVLILPDINDQTRWKIDVCR